MTVSDLHFFFSSSHVSLLMSSFSCVSVSAISLLMSVSLLTHVSVSFFLSVSLVVVDRCTDLTPLHSCTVASFSQPCHAHLATFPTHSRWLKACHKTDLHLTWWRSVSDRHPERERSGNSEAKHSIAAAAALAAAPEETASRHGHHSRLRSIPAAVETGND